MVFPKIETVGNKRTWIIFVVGVLEQKVTVGSELGCELGSPLGTPLPSSLGATLGFELGMSLDVTVGLIRTRTIGTLNRKHLTSSPLVVCFDFFVARTRDGRIIVVDDGEAYSKRDLFF